MSLGRKILNPIKKNIFLSVVLIYIFEAGKDILDINESKASITQDPQTVSLRKNKLTTLTMFLIRRCSHCNG